LIAFLRRRGRDNATPALSEEEHRRAAALLEQPKS
jgi:hypothetical protein